MRKVYLIRAVGWSAVYSCRTRHALAKQIAQYMKRGFVIESVERIA